MSITERLSTALADRYRIERHLGAGGMATVYLAQDIKHDRKVAIKVLKPELAAVLGAERFVVEIKTTAALQHPHILPLFDSGTADGFLFYVMPYVEGETLRDKLNRETQFGVDEAVRITAQVADALDYAHRHGVIHRDIKPENILLHDGRPMVADFGIALAVSAAAGGRMTETGLSLGTPHYMSPEQATAEKEITGRSDIYSLASVLYEMLTGNPPHTGASAQQIIMKIITEPVAAVTQFRKSVPPNVAAAVARALEKLPADRFESAAAFAQALGDVTFHGTSVEVGGHRAGAPAASRRTVVALGALAGLATLAFLWLLLKPAADAPVSRFVVGLPPDQQLAYEGSGESPRFAFTPDGRELVYVADSASRARRLLVRRLEDFAARELPGTEGARAPVVSWDGTLVAYIVFAASGGATFRVASLRGGPPLTVLDSGMISFPTWGPENFVYFVGSGNVIRRVASSGGPVEDVLKLPTPPSGSAYQGWLRILPGGRGALIGEVAVGNTPSGILNTSALVLKAIDLRTGKVGASVQGIFGEYVADAGALVYATADETLMAVPFDPRTLALGGRPIALFKGVDVRNGIGDLSIGGANLSYAEPGINAPEQVVWVRRDLATQELVDPDWRDPEFESFALSGDDAQLAITIRDASIRGDVWIKRLDRGPLSRLTFGGSENWSPAWSPDGRYVSYLSLRDGTTELWRRRADGAGAEERVAARGRGLQEAVWSRDGKWLLAAVVGPPSMDIVAMQVGTDTALRPLLNEGFDEWGPALSPDGRWIAYVARESGRPEVYVRPFPRVEDGKWQVSTGGSFEPVWSSDSRELFFKSEDGNSILVADLSKGPSQVTPRVAVRTTPDKVFETNQYDTMLNVTRDGRRFLIVRQGAGDVSGGLVVVTNFLTELRAALKAGAAK